MPTSPNGFATEKMSYPIISSLGLLTQGAYLPYAEQYPDLAGTYYIMAAEAQPGVLIRSPQKVYKSYRREVKPLNAFRITGDVSGAAGSTVTVTVLAADHMAGGTQSPVAIGLVFEDNSTGIHYEVVDVDKSNPGAHTADLVVATDDDTTAPALTAADSYLMSHGRPSVQEDSFQQDGEYRGWTSILRDHTAIRVNEKYTDLAKFEETDILGKTYFELVDGELEERFWNYQELRLMFGPVYANMQAAGNQNSDFKGVIPIVQDEGTSITPSGGLISDSFFEDVRLSMSANGFGKEFDVLADTVYQIELQKYFRAFTGVSGAIGYGNLQDGDVRLNFDFSGEFKYFDVRYAVKNYAFFDRQRTHGADIATGVWTGSALFIPKRQYAIGEGKTIPSFSIKYLSDPAQSGKVVHLLTDGGLVGKNTNMNVEVAYETWKSVDIPYPKEFIFSQM